MDRLPNAERAFVEEPKLGYLLRVEEKGGFFEAIGFSIREPDALRRSLLGHAREGAVAHTLRTPFGVKYVLDGPLKSPDAIPRPEACGSWSTVVTDPGS